MKIKISSQTLLGSLSTLVLVAATVAPNTVHIPAPVRPWIFLFTIAWTLLVTSGVFS